MKYLISNFIFLGFSYNVMASNLENACKEQAEIIVTSAREALLDFDKEEIKIQLISKKEDGIDVHGLGRETS